MLGILRWLRPCEGPGVRPAQVFRPVGRDAVRSVLGGAVEGHEQREVAVLGQ